MRSIVVSIIVSPINQQIAENVYNTTKYADIYFAD